MLHPESALPTGDAGAGDRQGTRPSAPTAGWGRLWKRKYHLSSRSVFALAVLIALMAAGSITLLHQDSSRLQDAGVLLSRLEKVSVSLDTAAAAAGDGRDAISTSRVTALEQQALPLLQQLYREDRDSATLPLVHREFNLFQRAIHDEFHWLQSGRTQDARAVYVGRVVPSFERLSYRIQDANQGFEWDAHVAETMGNVGTVIVLLVAAALGTSLFLRFQREQSIASRLSTEQKVLRESEARFQALARNASDVMAIARTDRTLQYLSSSVSRLWGYAPDLLEGRPAFDLVHPEDRGRACTLFDQARSTPGSSVTTELRMRHADGSWRSCEATFTNLFSDPTVDGMVFTYRDITERKAFEEQLAHQAFHDTLTGLANRALLMQRLEHALTRSQRHRAPIAILFLDLDNFKVINDSLGHEAGDELLKIVSKRLCGCVRACDTVARLGGDEFNVLLEDLNGEEDVRTVADRILQSLQGCVNIRGREVFTSGSLGIAISTGEYSRAEDLVRDADTAMYKAKTTGKASWVAFERGMNASALERLEIETELRRAVESGEMVLHYQPIMALESGRVTEVEALVRWHHPRRGLLSPDKFIPIAEEMGLIVQLGRWVLEEACWQVRQWQQQYRMDPPLVVSVNLSARQLQQPDLVEQVAETLRSTGLDPRCLKLEITESVMLHDPNKVIPKLEQLKELGIRMSVDNFGTGYSSMAYLSNLPIDTLKIDKSFISKLGKQEDDAAIIQAIIGLAKSLNLNITSEGIETPEQLQHLQELGCGQGQGFYLARPLVGSALEALLSSPAPVSGKRPSNISGALVAA